MEKDTAVALRQPGEVEDLLTDVLRQGACKLLAQAVEAEVADLLAAHADLTTEDGQQRLVRHGRLPRQTIQKDVLESRLEPWPHSVDRGEDRVRLLIWPYH